MALPQDTLSTEPVIGAFVGAAARDISLAVDYEDGPISEADPTEGLMFQEWRGRVVNNKILVKPANGEEYEIYSSVGISDFSFTFDQNARINYVYRDGENYWLYWFDPTLSAMTRTDLGTDMVTPKVTLDDKRFKQSGRSDIILAYVKPSDKGFYYRQQRDRYQIERLLDPGPFLSLEKMGKNDVMRLQFLLVKDE